MPKVQGGSLGGGRFLMGEVTLYGQCPGHPPLLPIPSRWEGWEGLPHASLDEPQPDRGRFEPGDVSCEEKCKATWERGFKLPWREAGQPNHHDDKADSDQ